MRYYENEARELGSVIVLEDEAEERHEILELLSLQRFEVVGVSSKAEFEDQLNTREFDAASIDWELNNRMVGPELIQTALRRRSSVGCVFLSKHDLSHEVTSADGLIRKPAGGLSENCDGYVTTIRKAVTVGVMRQIVGDLQALPGSDLPLLPHGQPVSSDITERVRKQSDMLITQEFLREDLYSTQLERPIERMARLGWWHSFDIQAYAEAPWQNKLRALISFVGLNIGEIRRITNLTEDAIIRQCTLQEVSQSRELFSLYSILGQLLEVTKYQPELLKAFGNTSKNL